MGGQAKITGRSADNVTRPMRGLPLIVVALALAATPAAARIYQWVDPDSGNVYLSGSPPAWYRSGARGPRVVVFEGGKVVDDTGRQTSEEESAALREKALLQEQVRREEQSALKEAASQTPESGAAGGEAAADAAADVGIENQFKASVAEYFKSVVNQYFDQMQRGSSAATGAPSPPVPAVPTTTR